MDTIAILFCKDFPEVVRKARRNEPTFLETKHSLVNGLIYWTGEASSKLISQKIVGFHPLDGYERLQRDWFCSAFRFV